MVGGETEERLGFEQCPEYCSDIVFAVQIGAGEARYKGAIRWVEDKEGCQLAGEKVRCCRLPGVDIDDVVAVEVTALPKEGLEAVIMVAGIERELLISTERPAGEGTRGRLHIIFCVIADAHREQLQ